MKVSKLTPAIDKGMTTNTRENVEGFTKDSLNILYSEADGAQTRPGSKHIPSGDTFDGYTIVPTTGGVTTVPRSSGHYLYNDTPHPLTTNNNVRENSGYSPSDNGIVLPPVDATTIGKENTPDTEAYYNGSVNRISIQPTGDMTARNIRLGMTGPNSVANQIGYRERRYPQFSGLHKGSRFVDLHHGELSVTRWYEKTYPKWAILHNRDVYTGHKFNTDSNIGIHKHKSSFNSVYYGFSYFRTRLYIRLVNLKINNELVADDRVFLKDDGEASIDEALARFFYCAPQHLDIPQCSKRPDPGLVGGYSKVGQTLVLYLSSSAAATEYKDRERYDITFDHAVAGMEFNMGNTHVTQLRVKDYERGKIFGIYPPMDAKAVYSSTSAYPQAMPDERINTVTGTFINRNQTPGLNTPNWQALSVSSSTFGETRVVGFIERFKASGDDNAVSDAAFTFDGPVSGTVNSNPHPLFAEQKIYNIGNLGGRMYVVSGKGIEFSQLGNIKNFYRQDITTFLADDPFRIPLTLSDKCTVIQYEGSILIRDGSRVYRILTSGPWVAANVKLLEVDIAPISNLLVVADRVMFLQATPSGVRLRSFSTGVRAEQVKITDHSKYYIIDPVAEGEEYLLGRRSDDSVWLARTGSEVVQVYAHVTSIDRRNWDVWTRFRLATAGLVIHPDNGDTVITSTGVQSIRSSKGTSTELYTLDSLKDADVTTPMFLADAKNLHGFGESALDPVYVRKDNGIPYRGGSTVLPLGEYTVGLPYSATLTLPELGFHDRYNRVDTANSGFIRKLRFKFKAARGVEVNHTETHYDPIKYAFDPLGSSFGHLSVDAISGLYDNLDAEIGMHSKVGATDVTLSNNNGLGFHLNEIELTGQFVVRTNRTT